VLAFNNEWPMKELKKVPKKNLRLAWRIIDDEAIVIPLEAQPKKGEKIYVFNKTATSIWRLIDGKMSVKNIIEKIIIEYEVNYLKAKLEVIRLIKELYKKNLIT
jgi:hypothetical protein